VTVARRRTTTLELLGVAMPAGALAPPLGRSTDLPLEPRDVPAPEAVAPVGRLRRCTFRRLDRVDPLPGRAARVTYEIMCLYGDGASPLPLGDIAEARPICEACTASGIFRPDEA
jgi:hypothetical protein